MSNFNGMIEVLTVLYTSNDIIYNMDFKTDMTANVYIFSQDNSKIEMTFKSIGEDWIFNDYTSKIEKDYPNLKITTDEVISIINEMEEVNKLEVVNK